jgi:scyllo-inositol 2-dehydrogenase (NADP+)
MSSKIRVGILAYGMSGKVFHAPLLHVNSGYDIVKIMQRSGNASLEKYPYAEIVHDADEIFHDKSIDLVIINTPDHTHYEYTKLALKAGKHVVVEKPFILDVDDGLRLIELAQKEKKILTVFQNRRWEGDFLTVQKVIKEKLLGRLVFYEARFDRFRNYIRDSWKEKPENKTGMLYNLGSHLIDQALVLFGMPDAVFADIRKQRTGSMVDDFFDLDLIYQDVKVGLKGSYLVREPGPRFVLHGTEGSFVKYGTDPQEEALTNGRYPDEINWGRENEESWGILNTIVNGVQYRGKYETLPGCYQEFYNTLYDSITKGKALAVMPEESLDVIRIIQAAYKSCEERSVILTK